MPRGRTALLVLLVAFAPLAAAWLSLDPCGDRCEDQGAPCAPLCATCTCDARTNPTITPAPAVAQPLSAPLSIAFAPPAQRLPASPDPREILRVPIHLV